MRIAVLTIAQFGAPIEAMGSKKAVHEELEYDKFIGYELGKRRPAAFWKKVFGHELFQVERRTVWEFSGLDECIDGGLVFGGDGFQRFTDVVLVDEAAVLHREEDVPRGEYREDG